MATDTRKHLHVNYAEKKVRGTLSKITLRQNIWKELFFLAINAEKPSDVETALRGTLKTIQVKNCNKTVLHQNVWISETLKFKLVQCESYLFWWDSPCFILNSFDWTLGLAAESQKPCQRVSNADRKVFANLESFCDKFIIGWRISGYFSIQNIKIICKVSG